MNTNHLCTVFTALAVAICARGMRREAGALGFDGPVQVAIVEDHPWVIIEESCGEKKMIVNNTCVSGFLVDVINQIKLELGFNITYTQFSAKGVYDTATKKLTELLGSVAVNATELGLSPTEQVEDYKASLDFTSPFYKTSQNMTYSLVFAKGSRLTPAFSHMIFKMENQRYLEMLKEKWFNEGKEKWSKDKQLSSS